MKFKLLYVAALVCAVLGMTACGDKPQHEHVWDGGTVTVQATCTADGQKKFTCTECGEERIEEIPAMGHATSAPEKENVVKSTCLEGGSYESVVYCLACGEELSRERVTVEASGHTPAPAVRENERAGDCKNKEAYDSVIYCEDCHAELERTHVEGDFGEHVWDEGQVVSEHSLTSDGKITYTCSSCGLTRDEVTPAGADFAQDFTLQSGGAWKYGYVNYDWAAEDFEFVSANSNGADAWTADGVEIKKGWINAGGMTAIGYTVAEDTAAKIVLSFEGGTELTRLALRVGIKNAQGEKYSNPVFYGPDGNGLNVSMDCTLNSGDTIYFIFSNEASAVEGAYPNGQLSITVYN